MKIARVIFPSKIGKGIKETLPGDNTVKVEEGMSSGGSTGMPATPAPTPFSIGPSGIRWLELPWQKYL